MSAHKLLLNPENLNYAWLKTKALLRTSDGFIDSAEIAAFEIDLEQRLQKIRDQFEKGSYKLSRLRPLPRPKKVSENGPIDRQYYHVAIQDQVAWIALINAIGPALDKLMPPWSYGNRLYRPAWYEPDEMGQSQLEIGPYRHASGHLYRKFKHSWPIFRRHVALTAQVMVREGGLIRKELDVSDQLAIATAEREKLDYFKKNWWSGKTSPDHRHDLYHASIDLEQFFPKLDKEVVIKGLKISGALDEPIMLNLVKSMLDFRLDTKEMTKDTMKNVVPPFFDGRVEGLPTGLFVSGFLANAAMLPVDEIVAQKLACDKNIAHFRFVDDHTILAYDFDMLCDWIIWYEELLNEKGIGASINTEKFDPPAIGELLKPQAEGSPVSERKDTRDQAMQEARLDGRNPTRLMTKTLAQVSAIATTAVHILDDEDLDERLNMLEWLLLADIPEREIRSDTRASFAAGQIASLAPVLVQEISGFVEDGRRLALHKAQKPDSRRSSNEDIEEYALQLQYLEDKYRDGMKKQEVEETRLLKRCFELLLQSLQEYPGKARLFFRIHQYCRVTGHMGLRAIGDWLVGARNDGREVWADYYTGLSLQIMAKGILSTVYRLTSSDSLRSDVIAAERHLKDIANLNTVTFTIPQHRETWFHRLGRVELGVVLVQAAALIESIPSYRELASQFQALSKQFLNVGVGSPSKLWIKETGWPAGVWAHHAERSSGLLQKPSLAWSALSSSFDFGQRLDLASSRRYPEQLPDGAWITLLKSNRSLPRDDSAWLSQVLGDDKRKIAQAAASSKRTFNRAAQSKKSKEDGRMSLVEWSEWLKKCNPFDPRRSEWTALEIGRQILEQIVAIDGDIKITDPLHPCNLLIPSAWITEFSQTEDPPNLGWEKWRNFVNDTKNGKIVLRSASSYLWDYRFANESKSHASRSVVERLFASMGQLLLGLLRNDHATPTEWNLRGNEQIMKLPRSRWYRELAISSVTTQLLEASLAERSAESRNILNSPGLFAWKDGDALNDVSFDPEEISSPNDFLLLIQAAQKVLEENQLYVSSIQPRQLIPFRLADFAAGEECIDAGRDGGGDDGE